MTSKRNSIQCGQSVRKLKHRSWFKNVGSVATVVCVMEGFSFECDKTKEEGAQVALALHGSCGE